MGRWGGEKLLEAKDEELAEGNEVGSGRNKGDHLLRLMVGPNGAATIYVQAIGHTNVIAEAVLI